MGSIYRFDGLFSFFGIFFTVFVLIFIVIICVFIYSAVRGIGQWNKNNHSPRLTVNARIVSKRMDVSYHHHRSASGHGMHTTSSSRYYVTFQVESGDRMELSVSGYPYGMMAEGDCGQLTFQGTRYIDFIRQR